MSLSSYSDIQNAISTWLNRQDLDAKIPDFITLCEADLQRNVIHEMGMSNRDVMTSYNGYITLPDDFNGVISFKGTQRIKFVTLNQFDSYDNPSAGDPSEYTLSGGRAYLGPNPPVDGSQFTLTYKVKIDLLRFGPNWILENHPDAYLYGSLIHAEPYIVEDERVPLWKSYYDKIIRDIELDGIRQAGGGYLQLQSTGPR